jgi:penicillin amidase
VGETADGDALNGPLVDGRPLYVNSDYDPGFRVGRITRRIEALIAAGQPITLEDLGSIQADTSSSYGGALRDHVVAAAARLAEERANPGTHPDLEGFAAALTPERALRLEDAATRLAGWSLETPPAVEGNPGAGEIADSAATTIFNAWAVSFLQRAFADELASLGFGGAPARPGLFVFTRAAELHTGLHPVTGEAALCDSSDTPAVDESCAFVAVLALDDALAWAESAFATDDMDRWRWGELHRLTLEALVPSDSLNVPNETDPVELRAGFPRPGDNFSVDASSPGLGDLDFRYGHGPSIRHLVEFTAPGTPHARIALPGGQVFDRSSPHFRDLVDEYWRHNQYFDLPWTVSEIIDHAETRIRFTGD